MAREHTKQLDTSEAAPDPQECFERPIKTTYYADFTARQVVKRNRGGTAFKAVPKCIEHMQVNQYAAVLAEVWDDRDGVLHAVVKRSIDGGKVTIIYQREVTRGV